MSYALLLVEDFQGLKSLARIADGLNRVAKDWARPAYLDIRVQITRIVLLTKQIEIVSAACRLAAGLESKNPACRRGFWKTGNRAISTDKLDFHIARFPHIWQAKCAFCATGFYTLSLDRWVGEWRCVDRLKRAFARIGSAL